MSNWTYISGVIIVSVPGRTQHQINYVINSVLDHLPKVTGSERDMSVYVNKCDGHNSWSSHDEFGQRSNLIPKGLDLQSKYLLTVNASLRNREIERTYDEFLNWLTRLAKRIPIDDVFVKIHSYGEQRLITEDFSDLFEYENPWYDYLLDNVSFED